MHIARVLDESGKVFAVLHEACGAGRVCLDVGTSEGREALLSN